MISAPRLIIFTDLDGSLLDHFTYSFEPAIPLLKSLEQLHIPVIFTTSKTATEVEYLRRKIGNLHPFIVENGAGILIPEYYFTISIPELKQKDEYLLKSFVAPHKHWIALLDHVDPKFKKHFKSFTMLSETALAQITGLSLEQARCALLREFGEPVSWSGSAAMKIEFVEELKNLGAHILEGGRFIHVSGNCDKGRALNWLLAQYSEEYQEKCLSLAAGDSGNDVAMLEAANISLIIRSPVHAPPYLEKSSNIFLSSLYGPEGWVEGIEQILSELSIAN
jgi:mannosyl-3-phosphoglycerate phosphatase family protein